MHKRSTSIEQKSLLGLHQPDQKPKKRMSYLWLGALAALAVFLVVKGYDLEDLKKLHPGGGCGKGAEGEKGEMREWSSPGWFPAPRGGTVQTWTESHERAAKLVSKMSLLEKVNVTSGVGWEQGLCLGNTAPATNVDFPGLCLHDGPLGLRFVDHATAWPAALTAGATWNRELIYARGAGHGDEARRKGINVILGPSMGPLGRMPQGGRNWEGFGTDPFLQGVAAAETIRGIQDQGVIATAKHFILNEQEHFRQRHEWSESFEDSISGNVDERTLHEMYLWPFADSVRAGVGSVMCSYNQVNNSYGCQNSRMMNGILKDELGFQGFVQSDWWGGQSGVWAALGGLDVMMPGTIQQKGNVEGASFFGGNLTLAVMNGTVPLERLDDAAARVVAAWYQMGQDDKERFPEDKPNFSAWTDEEEDYLYHGADSGPRGVVNKYVDVQGDHWKIARRVAMEGTVLVKNVESALPLKRGAYKGKKIGIFGEDAGDDNQPGFPNFCKDRGCNKGSLGSGWGSGAAEFPYFHTPQSSLRRGFNTSSEDIPEFVAVTDNEKLKDIAEGAASSDLCFAFINSDAGEGFIKDPLTGVHGDRLNLDPQLNGNSVVAAVADNCASTIVVIHAVGPVLVEAFADHPNVTAILLAHLPGPESGEALTPLLFGDESPSGKLPYTVGKSLESYGPGAEILFHPKSVPPQQTFHEKLLIDYRHFDKNDIAPRYEFGFGLSYTTFEYSNLKAVLKTPKTPFAAARPELLTPPTIDSEIPGEQDVLFPPGFEKIKHRIYPYLDSIPTPGALHLPEGYTTPRPLSPAGGGEGGNPGLWEIMAEVTLTVKNTGEIKGAEVVQVYVSFPPVEGEEFPVRVLRGFEKVVLEKGESREVKVGLRRRDLSYWDVEVEGGGNWRVPEGRHGVCVGGSSRDLRGCVDV